MIKCLFVFCFCLMVNVAQAEKPAGFLWYNLPRADVTKKPQGVAFNKLSYTDRDAVLKFYTMEALHKVRFTHRVEDERVFLAMQSFWINEASIHGRLNQETLLQYPEYDFSVTHPTSSIGTSLHDSLIHQQHQTRLLQLAKTHGLLFFYRANNPYDQKQIPILRDFCSQFHFTLIPISVDGTRAPDLPNSRLDNGQADALGVRYFPAVLLVNPATQESKPIAYGLTTQDVLTQHLIAVATHFKGDEA